MGEIADHSAPLSVAGLTFIIESPDLPLFFENEPAYLPFRSPGGKGAETVKVLVRAKERAVPESSNMLFDTGESWQIHADGDDRWMTLSPPALGGSALWTARISPEVNEVEIFAGEESLREEEGRRAVSNPFRYPLDQIAIMYFLAGRGILLHAAGAMRRGRGYLFAGVSGAGKSTIAGLVKQYGAFDLLGDDRIVARRDREGLRIFGTPWPGEAGIARNDSGSCSGIFFLGRGESTEIRELEPGEAMRRLMPVVTLPLYDRPMLERSLGFCERVLDDVPARELNFLPGRQAVETLEAAL